MLAVEVAGGLGRTLWRLTRLWSYRRWAESLAIYLERRVQTRCLPQNRCSDKINVVFSMYISIAVGGDETRDMDSRLPEDEQYNGNFYYRTEIL